MPQLRAVCEAIEDFDAEISRVCPALPDYELFRALPGAGPPLAPRLLVAFGERRERFPAFPTRSRCSSTRESRR